MFVKLTGEAEKERLQKRTLPTWELYRGTSIVKAVRTARDMGWGKKEVQVRVERLGTDIVEYVVEPYEEGCSCRGLLKYVDYYETEDINGI